MGFQEGRFLREKLNDAHEVLFSKSVRKNEHLATMFDTLLVCRPGAVDSTSFQESSQPKRILLKEVESIPARRQTEVYRTY